MGGASTIRELGEAIEPLWKSTERVFSESAVGRDLVQFIKNDIEPTIGKRAEVLTKQVNPVTNAMHTPVEAMQKSRNEVYESAFGKRRQGLIPILQAAKQQKGDIHASQMAEGMNMLLRDENQAIAWRGAAAKAGIKIKASSSYSAPGHIEGAVRGASRNMFLPLISVPHAFQAPLNGLLVNGWADTARAFADFTTDIASAKKLAADSGALSQDLVHEFVNQTKGTSMFSNLLDPLRKVFSFERKWGIAFSAVGGKWSALRAAEEFATTGSKRSELQLKLLGLDPVLIKEQKGILSQADIEQAAFRSASEIMGFRSQLETPYLWEGNAMARMTMIYKHYGYREARLIKNMLVQAKEGEGLLGVAKIGATLAIAFPIAGEIVKAAEGVLTLQNPWSAEKKKSNIANSEYLDALASAGGLGMMYSITRSARTNHLGGYIMGPYFSTAVDLAQDIMNARGRNVTKDVLRRMGLPGRAASNVLLPPKKKASSSSYY
jgi:hypothetical protein